MFQNSLEKLNSKNCICPCSQRMTTIILCIIMNGIILLLPMSLHVTIAEMVKLNERMRYLSELKLGIILSSYYCGAIISHTVGGIILQNYVGKYMVGVALLTASINTVILPILPMNC